MEELTAEEHREQYGEECEHPNYTWIGEDWDEQHGRHRVWACPDCGVEGGVKI